MYILTIFDKNYLVRTLAFYESTLAHVPNSQFILVYPDKESELILKKLDLPKTKLCFIDNINDHEFISTKGTRTPVEYMITAKSCWMNHLINSDLIKENELCAFFDPDIYFYENAQGLISQIEASGDSIFITPHKFSREKQFLNEKSGVYNAGMIFFRKDDNARACLHKWSRQCIDWCYLRNENGNIGDQGYLTHWPKLYKGVHEILDKGFNLGTWNVKNYTVTKNVDGKFFIDKDPLICYHFHGLKLYRDKHDRIKPYPINIYHTEIYTLYIKALERSYARLKKIDADFTYGFAPPLSTLRYFKQKVSRWFF